MPSGRRVRLSDQAARAAIEAFESRDDSLSSSVRILGFPQVAVDLQGSPVAVGSLAVEDAQVLRAFLVRARILRERPRDYTCENCDAVFRLAPTCAWEAAPFLDGELDDPELDASFDFERDYEVSSLRVGRKVARTIRLAHRSVDEAEPLWRAAAGRRPLALPERLTPALVIAMGITAVGSERRVSTILSALTKASEDAWADIVDIVHAAHYPPRLVATHRCAKCGANNYLDVPRARELSRGGPPQRAPGRDDFMTLDEFERIVRKHAERVYRQRGVKNIALWIDDGVPLCDDGGEPLLGCYTPPGTEPLISSQGDPEIRIFYRTFQTEFRYAAAREIEEEIRETIDHEVTHHLHFLAGDDPLDDAEQAEIYEENRRIVGRAETGRRELRGASTDLRGFFRAAWPLLLLALVMTLLAYCR